MSHLLPISMMTLLGLLLILVVLAAFAAPLVPMRRRQGGLAGLPLVTIALVALNFAIFVATSSDGELQQQVALHWGLIPNRFGVLPLVAHMFLHGSWLHLLSNLLWLWLFGPHVEEALGHLEYLGFYFGCGIAAGLLHLLMAETVLPGAAGVPLVGASGAIFGVLGLFAVRFWRARVRLFFLFSVPAALAVGAFAFYQIMLGIISLGDGGKSDSVANWAHVGGFIFGALLSIPLKMGRDSKREYDLEDAEKAAARGDDGTAAAHLRDVVYATPEDASAHHQLARAYIGLRQATQAHKHLTEAIKLYVRQGDSLSAARVYEDARRAFENFPVPPPLLQRVASACEESGQYTLAAQALSQLMSEHPQAKEAELSLLRLGKLYLHKMNQPRQAESVFSEFVRGYPQSEWAPHAERWLNEARARIR